MECFIIVQGQSEAKAAGYLDPASPTAIFVHYSCMDFHEEKKPMLCSTLKTFEKKKRVNSNTKTNILKQQKNVEQKL